MKKRVIALILAVIMLVSGMGTMTFADDAADESNTEASVQVGKIDLYTSNAPDVSEWIAALKDDVVMMMPGSIATIAGVNLEIYDSEYVFDRDGYCVRVDVEKSEAIAGIMLTETEYTTLYSGSFKLEEIVKTTYKGEEIILFPLEQMLYLLNVQWYCSEECVYTIAAEYTMFDVLSNYAEILGNAPTKAELLGGTEHQLAKYFYYASLAYLDEINPLYMLDNTGVDDVHLKDALLLLAEPCTGTSEAAKNSISDQLSNYVSDISELYAGVSDQMGNSATVVQLIYDTCTGMNQKVPEAINQTADILDFGSRAADVAIGTFRYQSWSDSYIEQLNYLRNISFSDKEYREQLNRVAGNLYDETDGIKDNLLRLIGKELVSLIADKVVDETPYGKFMAAYDLVVDTAKIIPVVDEAFTAGDAYYFCNDFLWISTVMQPKFKKAATALEGGVDSDNISEVRTTMGILVNSSAHFWDKLIVIDEFENNEELLDEHDNKVGFYGALVTRLNESKKYDNTLILNTSFSNLYSEANGAHREMIPPEYVKFDELPYIHASHIVEINGKVYSSRDVPDPRITTLEFEAAQYGYIATFAYYGGKIYYLCKTPGTSDFGMALYRCKPDGSEQELLKDFGEVNASVGFHINTGPGKLYPWYGTEYYDLKEDTWVETNDPIGFHPGALWDVYSADYCYSYGIGGCTMSEYEEQEDGRIVYSNEKTIIQGTSNIRLEAGVSYGVYYQTYGGNYASLYLYNLETGQSELIEEKLAAGSGLYFNY